MRPPNRPKRIGSYRQHCPSWLRSTPRLAACVCIALLMLGGLWRIHSRRVCEAVPVPLPLARMYETPPTASLVHKPRSGEADVRTEFVTSGSSANEALCAHWISATLTGVQTTAAGWGVTNAHTLDKLRRLSQTAELKGMRDWDVVVYVNQTSMFTGIDIQSFVDDFVHYSAAHPDEINVRDIRQGKRMAPLRFATAASCVAPRTLVNSSMCESSYFRLDEAIERHASNDQFTYLPHVNVTRGRSNEPFLNSGFFMARVWALKELAAAQNYLVDKMPHLREHRDAEQSVLTALYLDMRWDEVRLGLLAPASLSVTRPTVNQFGLHYGLIDLWHSRPPLALSHIDGIPDGRTDASLYEFPFHTPMYPCAIRPSKPEVTIRGVLLSIPSPQRFVHNVPLRYTHPEGITTIPLAPPLLGTNPRFIDRTPEGGFRSSFPCLIDVPVRGEAYCRVEVSQFLGWSLVLDLKAGQREASAAFARSATVPVVDDASRKLKQVSLGEQCQEWIDNNIVNGEHTY